MKGGEEWEHEERRGEGGEGGGMRREERNGDMKRGEGEERRVVG